MADVIVGLLIVAILAAAIIHIVKEKKRGAGCVGCPAAGTCGRQHKGETACGGGSGAGECSGSDTRSI